MRPAIQEILMPLKKLYEQQIIQNLKLNHGLFLNGDYPRIKRLNSGTAIRKELSKIFISTS